MLERLRIENLAIISTCELQFGTGFTVLTGETGAGKSLIIEAISLLTGATASDDLIKDSENMALIEGVFCVPEGLRGHARLAEFLDDENRLLIVRKLVRGRSSSVRINGETVPLKVLREITQGLAAIVSQHAHWSLFQEETQLLLLDQFCESELEPVLTEYQTYYRDYLTVKTQLDQLREKQDMMQQQLALMKFQIDDIDQPQFNRDEETQLLSQRANSKNHHQLKTGLAQALSELDAIQLATATSSAALSKLLNIDAGYQEALTVFSQMSVLATEAQQQLELRCQRVAQDQILDIEAIESRLDIIFRYKTKYKMASLEALLDYRDDQYESYQKQSALIENRSALEAQRDVLFQQCETWANKVSHIRKKQAKALAGVIIERLQKLHFVYCDFKIMISDADLSSQGKDCVQFLISTNPGSPVKPLQKVASGGEMSRILLAIKTVFYRHNPVSLLVFDEVDTGVGGMTAITIGEYLKMIAQFSQVICVTHLPQIAKFGDWHYVISKQLRTQSTETTIRLLARQETRQELERMVGGADMMMLIRAQ